MLIGVVSDTHNRVDHVKRIVNIFNEFRVGLVIHTGDITNRNTLQYFHTLKCPLKGVFGNNDLNEIGLEEICLKNNFDFRLPPYVISLENRKIAIFHEPDLIDSFLEEEKNIDLVLHGHTHRYRNEDIEGIKYFNPGECAGSFKGKNSIGVVNLENLEIKRIFF